MQSSEKIASGHRLVLGFVLLLALGLAGSFVRPSFAHAAPVHDDTITYIVKSGDTLRSIAAAHGTSISAIVRGNGLANPDVIYPGQKLVIAVPGRAHLPDQAATNTPPPAATSTPAASSVNVGRAQDGAPVYYTVALGDTLASIGGTYGVSAADIAGANRIDDPDLIWVGQQLLIPGATPPAAADAIAASTPAPPSQTTPPPLAAAQPLPPQPTARPALTQPRVYTVQAGDTLSTIAVASGVTVAEIVAANALPNANLLRIGQELVLPRPGDPALTTAALRPSKLLVSISQQRCYLYQGETLLTKWVCSTGRPGAATRPGAYKIQSKLPKAFGSTWNIWMPYWLGIYWAGASENGIHGLPWNADSGAQVWTGYVGTPITFGCVMLDNINAKMLYDMAWIGMPVIIRP